MHGPLLVAPVAVAPIVTYCHEYDKKQERIPREEYALPRRACNLGDQQAPLGVREVELRVVRAGEVGAPSDDRSVCANEHGVEANHGVVAVNEEREGPKEDEDERFAPLAYPRRVARLKPRLPTGEIVLVPGNDETKSTEDLSIRAVDGEYAEARAT